MRTLVQRLIAEERRIEVDPGKRNCAAFRICQKLRPPLCTFAGVAGFRSLLSRALVLARAKAPLLGGVQVNPDGSLQLSTEMEAQLTTDEAARAGAILADELLKLLAVFIGEALTLRLVYEVWPKAAHGDQKPGKKTP